MVPGERNIALKLDARKAKRNHKSIPGYTKKVKTLYDGQKKTVSTVHDGYLDKKGKGKVLVPKQDAQSCRVGHPTLNIPASHDQSESRSLDLGKPQDPLDSCEQASDPLTSRYLVAKFCGVPLRPALQC